MRWTRSLSLFTFASVVGALAQTGCNQTEVKTALQADGSGTQTDSMSIEIQKTKDIIEMYKTLAGGGGPGAGPQVPDVDIEKSMDARFSEEEIRRQMKEIPGVEVKSLKSEKKDGKRKVDTEIAFADFSALGKANLWTAVDLVKNADGTWTLSYDVTGGMLGMMGKGGGGAVEGMPAGIDMSAVMGYVEGYLGTLELKRSVTLPGEIVETDGVKGEDGKTVSWKVAFKDLSTPRTDGKATGSMSVRFKGEGLKLKPFSYRPDIRDAMKVIDTPAVTPGTPAPVTPPPVTPTTPETPKPETPKTPEGK